MSNNKIKNDFTIDFTIDYYNPIELKEFTNSLNGLSNQYVKFLKERYGDERPVNAKLHIEKIKEGSIIAQLVEYSDVTLSFLGNINTIADFGNFLKNCYEHLLKNKEDEEIDFDKDTLNNLLKIIEPGTHPNNTIKMDVKGDNNTVINVFSPNGINDIESRAIRDSITNKKKEILDHNSNEYFKQSFYFSQAKKDTTSTTGNYGQIDNILKNEQLKVIFENDTDKEKMINGDHNPLNSFFIVDVEVQYVKNKPKVYKIIKLHEIINE